MMSHPSPQAYRGHILPRHIGYIIMTCTLLLASHSASAVEVPGFWYIFDPNTGSIVYGSGVQTPGSAYFTTRPIGGPANIDSVANAGYRQTVQTLTANAQPYPGTPTLSLTPPPGFLAGGPATGGVAVAGYVGVGVLAGVAIYKSGQYYYYTQQLVNDVGSEPANNLTEYEDPANYWQQFWSYYWPSSNG